MRGESPSKIQDSLYYGRQAPVLGLRQFFAHHHGQGRRRLISQSRAELLHGLLLACGEEF